MHQEGIDAAWSAGERVMVCLDYRAQAQNLIRRGGRMATRYKTELLAVFVETPHWGSASPERKRAIVRGSIVQNLLRLAGDVDIHLVADCELRDR